MAEKSKYVILISAHNASFYKINDETLQKVNVINNEKEINTIDTLIALTKNYIDFEFTMEEMLSYPSGVQYFCEPFVPYHLNDVDNSEFVSKNLCLIVKKCLDLLNEKIDEKKEIYCFTTNFCFGQNSFFDYSYVNSLIKNSEYRKMNCIVEEMYLMFSEILPKKNPIYIASDSTIEIGIDERHAKSNLLVEHFEDVETIIRNKYYFLSKFDENMIFSISLAFFYETLKENRKNECIFQDISIVFEDEDYNKIEEIIINAYYERLMVFKKDYPNGIYIDLTTSTVSKRLFKEAVCRLNDDSIIVIDAVDLIPILCEYHKINCYVTNLAHQKSYNSGCLDVEIVTDRFLKKTTKLSSKQKLEIKSKITYFKNKTKDKVMDILNQNKCLQK